ncbi:MAG: NAD(P)/FAD-dependent oxidoreductase [Chloroflexi bacterium]|nr:NAD(P)/FAD-dependent oxidoreductase [Chloroflexota bacterium]
MTSTRKRYLIIGNGASGTYAAETIRKSDAEGEITLLTNEPYPLYNRVALPPFLRDEARREKVFLRTPEQHAQKGIKLLVDTQIDTLDTEERVATASDGTEFPYDRLLIATGGRPNPLPAPGATSDIQGIYNFQYWDDAAAIRERMNTAKHAVVVGGSYIAYELAEAFRHHGLVVTWLIRGPRFLRRVLDEDGGALVDDIARAAGVDIHYGGEVAEVHARDGQVCGVTTTTGDHIQCDMIGVGLGVTMNVDLLRGTPVTVQSGIVTNEYLETILADIYAAGDVAEFFDVSIGTHNQMGTWNNSVSHGRIAGANMLGERKFYNDVPMYSTGLFDSRIRVMGLTPENLPDLESWARLDAANRNYQRLFFKDGRLVGGCLIGDIKMQTRIIQMIQARQVTPEVDRGKLLAA